MMRALLHAQGMIVTRTRVREMLMRINPTAAARRWSRTVARRVYYAPYPNSLWHIDGNMRLIRLVIKRLTCEYFDVSFIYLSINCLRTKKEVELLSIEAFRNTKTWMTEYLNRQNVG